VAPDPPCVAVSRPPLHPFTHRRHPSTPEALVHCSLLALPCCAARPMPVFDFIVDALQRWRVEHGPCVVELNSVSPAPTHWRPVAICYLHPQQHAHHLGSICSWVRSSRHDIAAQCFPATVRRCLSAASSHCRRRSARQHRSRDAAAHGSSTERGRAGRGVHGIAAYQWSYLQSTAASYCFISRCIRWCRCSS
jgi:hypothetical protein